MIRMMVMMGMGAIVFIADVAVDDGDHAFSQANSHNVIQGLWLRPPGSHCESCLC